MGNMIAKAEIVARLAHRGQIDKSGNDYAEHCSAVACIASEIMFRDGRSAMWQHWNETIAAAWLHDTIEDTPLSVHDLRNLGFTSTTVGAVSILTEYHDAPHDDLVRRARDAEGAAGQVARIVREADILHNGDPSRGGYMTHEKLIARKDHALAILRGDIP
jgi:(p)ppGpp synthase/HD superfamily hydrolase